MSAKNPLENLLKLALSMSTRHHEYYSETADNVETPQVRALLRVLADTERDLIIEIQDMNNDELTKDEVSFAETYTLNRGIKVFSRKGYEAAFNEVNQLLNGNVLCQSM